MGEWEAPLNDQVFLYFWISTTSYNIVTNGMIEKIENKTKKDKMLRMRGQISFTSLTLSLATYHSISDSCHGINKFLKKHHTEMK